MRFLISSGAVGERGVGRESGEEMEVEGETLLDALRMRLLSLSAGSRKCGRGGDREGKNGRGETEKGEVERGAFPLVRVQPNLQVILE